MRERVADDFRLLVNFLGHEVAMVALVDEERRGIRFEHRALDRMAGGVMNLGAAAMDDNPVAIFQIADRIRERSERDGVGAEEHLAVAVADRQWRAAPRADQQVFFALEQERQRERAFQPRQRRRHRLDWAAAFLHFGGHEMGHHFGVGLGHELGAAGLELGAQLAEIFDDAVVNDRHPVGGVRVRVGFIGPAMGRPAGVADAAGARSRFAHQPLF